MTAPNIVKTQKAEVSKLGLQKERRRNREAIEFLLRGVRTKSRTRLALEFLLWFFVIQSTFMLVIFLSILVFSKASASIALFGFWALVILSGLGLVFGVVILLTTKPSLYAIANTLENACSDLRSDVVAALQFSEEGQTFDHLSEVLASEHVERTARKLQVKESEDSLFSSIPQRPLNAPIAGTLAALMIIFGLYKLTEKKTDKLLAELLQEVEKIDAQMAKRPLIGGVSIQYTFPKYAKRQSEFVNSTGNINTLSGTEVSFTTYPLIAASDFELLLLSEQESGAEQETIPLVRQSDRTLSAQFIITKNGSYEVRAVAIDKGVLIDPLVRTIKVQKDIAPSVSISSHRGEIEVSPEDRIEFAFDINDDFGIESINGVYYFSGAEKKENRIVIDTPELALVPQVLSGRFVLDLSRLKLQPKDRIVFQIEATDNNALTGPGTGRSSEIVLRVTSQENKHLRLIARQQGVRDAMIDLLGDFLAVPIGNRVYTKKRAKQSMEGINSNQYKERFEKYNAVYKKEGVLLENMERLVNDLKADPLLLKRDFQTFNGIYLRVKDSHKGGEEDLLPPGKTALSRKRMRRLAAFSGTHEHVLETSLIALEGLVRQQKIDAISDTQAQIREIRDRLKALLEKYKESKDPDLKAAIFREIARLRQRMTELLERMQTQVQNLPRDHMNMDALEDQELVQQSKDLATGVERIEDLLQKNDIDGAISALDELTKNLNELNAQLDSQMDEQQGSGVSELDNELSALMDKVNDLELAQKSIEKKTRELQLKNEASKKKEVQKLMEGRLEEIDKLLAEQISDARKLSSKALNRNEVRGVGMIQSRLAKIVAALKQDLLENALEESVQSNKEMRSLEFSLELSRSYSKKARGKRKKIVEALSKMQEMIPKQRDISNRLRNIIAEAQSAKNDSQESPEFDPIREEQKKVAKNAKALKKEIEKASDKFPMLQGELGYAMKKTEKEMKSSDKALKKKRAQQSLDHQRSALEELLKMKKSMQETMKKERQGEKKKKGEKVAIPKNGEKSSNIRDEVQKRMKDGKLNDYASEIERYYKSLTR